jgi:guanine deaminase
VATEEPGAGALVVEGPAFTTRGRPRVDHVPASLWLVDAGGVLRSVVPADARVAAEIRLAAKAAGRHFKLRRGQYLLPGLVDTHIHAPQWAQTGTGLDQPLEAWLERYTFALEARFADLEWARTVYSDLVRRLLSLGTTTAVYYGTVHRRATELLATLAAGAGQRAFVGKVVQDDPDANPASCRDASTAWALAETERFLETVAAIDAPQGVWGVITPRFVPSCTPEALLGLGRLARATGAFVQTHLSEGDWEHGFALERYGVTDAQLLDQVGLLGPRTILGHVVHATDDDARLLARRAAAVAHCPHSNAYFAGAVAPVRRLRDRFGLRVGLGSDISGGWSPSLWQTIRQTVVSSRMLEAGVDAAREERRRGVPGSALTLDDSFHLATAGGAEALGLRTGQLSEGYWWDAIVLDTEAPGNRLPIFDDPPGSHRVFEKIAHLATAANIREVWVRGRSVHPRHQAAPANEQKGTP